MRGLSGQKCLVYFLLIVFTLMGCTTTRSLESSREGRSDEEITQEVTEKLNAQFPLGTPKNFIAVKTVKGVVYLSGTVESSTIKSASENIARNVEGVKDVINFILVKPNP